MNELLNNNWFISLASSILTLGIVPTITSIVNTIRARSGIFTGTYIAITTVDKMQIIELVKCKHIKNNIKGKIFGVAFISKEGQEQKIQPNINKYDFKGNVAERLLVISYKSIVKGDLSAGSLTLYGNTYGFSFPGIWGGLEEGRVVSSPCEWIKSHRRLKLNLQKDRDFILSCVQSNHKHILLSDNVSGKSHSVVIFDRP